MGPLIFLDTETTGFDNAKDHLIEIACIRWKDGVIEDRFESLVNPHVPIPQEITMLTGITDADVKVAPRFSEISTKLLDFLQDFPIVGHNIAFDAGFLRSHHEHLKNPEIDTCSLARIVLEKEASYALEVLMRKYKLPMRESHRAMADTETALSFFEFVLAKIQEIPAEAREIVHQILNKSTWPAKEIFIEELAKGFRLANGKDGKNFKLQNSDQYATNHTTWNSQITSRFLAGEKILLESSREIPLAELKNTSTCISYATARKREEIVQLAMSKQISVAVLKEPQFYYSPKKLMEAINGKEVLKDETPFLLKMAIWGAKTVTGDREELNLEREEFGLFETVSDTAGADIFWQKSLKQMAHSTIVLIHQGALANGITKVKDFSFNNLIVTEASRLEDSITNSHFVRFSERTLRLIFAEKATVLFGLLGIFYNHFAEEDYAGFLGNVILNDQVRSSIQWQNVLDAASHLPDHPIKITLISALQNTDPNAVRWISSWNDDIAFQMAPIKLANIFQTNIEKFKHVLIHDEALSGDSTFGLVKNLFALDAWTQIRDDYKPTGALETIVREDFPEPNTEGYFKKCFTLFSEIIDAQKGRAIFLVNSNKSVEAFYKALLPYCESRNVKLLGVKVSGGTGKSVSLFLDDPTHSVLIATAQVLPYLENIGEHTDTVVFQKVAFDAPDNPICKSRCQLFNNGFTGYSLPRAIMKFRSLLSELSKQGVKKCYVLDKRLKSREYGDLFFV